MNQKVNIKLLFFGVAKELANTAEIQLDINSKWQTVDDLLKFICEDFNSNLSILRPFVTLALNEEYLMDKNKPIILEDKSVLAVIPPICGG